MGNGLRQGAIRKSDSGLTWLADGSRVEKNSPRIEMLGVIDELNCWVGVIVSLCNSDEMKAKLKILQHDLLDLSAGVEAPGSTLLSYDHVDRLVEVCAILHARLPAQTEVILPGGSQSASYAHVARSVSRRAERQLLSLMDVDPQPSSHAKAYLNCLSEVLFLVAKTFNREQGVPETSWSKGF